MDREPPALDFGETIESLRNEVESMWDEIQISFDKIDREIDATINRYKPSSIDSCILYGSSDIDFTQVIYESDPNTDSDTEPKRYSNTTQHHLMRPMHMAAINSITSSISSAASPTLILASPTNYSTPVQSHSISATDQYHQYEREPTQLKHYDSYQSELDIALSDLTNLTDFNRNDVELTDNPGVPGIDCIGSKSLHRIDLSNPNDSFSPKITDINHMDDINIARGDGARGILRESYSDGDDIVNNTQHRMALINRISNDLESNAYAFKHQNSHHQRNNTQKEIDEYGLLKYKDDTDSDDANELDLTQIKKPTEVEVEEDEDDNSGHSSLAYLFKDDNSDSNSNSHSSFDDEVGDSDEDGLIVLSEKEEKQRSVSHRSRNSKTRLSIPRGLSNIDLSAELANVDKDQQNDDSYPLSLPAIPQTSSVDHNVDASQTPQDVTYHHEKKKSISQLALQDLELDRKVNMNHHNKVSASFNYNETTQPLTPLAMMTQIGLAEANMPDFNEISIPESAVNVIPSPSMSEDSNGYVLEHEFDARVVDKTLAIGSRMSINENHNITDINYANNHSLPSGINRADSEYKPMINQDIDAILRETELYEQQQGVMASPDAVLRNPKLMNNLSYSIAEFSNKMNAHTPVINEDESCNGMEFGSIGETLFIIKQSGERFINFICDKLANDDAFYINEYKELHKEDVHGGQQEYERMDRFLNKHNCTKNVHVEAVCALFKELVSESSFCIIPLYRVNAIAFLYQQVVKYQSLQLVDDDIIENENRDTNDFGQHAKKPTNELRDIDNVYFDDYNEYPSDDDKNEKRVVKNNGNEREMFGGGNVYAPKNNNEYMIMKQVLWPNTKYHRSERETNGGGNDGKYMESIGIIKPNAVKNESEATIRATLIGNGFIISKCKAIKCNKHKIKAMLAMGMDSYAFYKEKGVMERVVEYLSSGVMAVIVIKKLIKYGVNDCFNELAQLIGYIDPQIDRQNDENTQTIRGCFGEDLIKNAIAVTLTAEHFKNNMKLFFD